MLKPHEKHEQTIIKRSGGKAHDDEHGGAWKVAFADFCLALLSLFLVLWLMAAREQQAMREIMKQAGGSKHDEGSGVGVTNDSKGGPRGSLIDHMKMPTDPVSTTQATQAGDGPKEPGKGDPGQVPPEPKVKYDSPSDLAALAKALAEMSAEAGLTSNLQAVVTPYGLRVMLHDTDRLGMFVRGSAIPTDRFRRLLRKMGPLFARMENQMLIVGHTDSLQYADTGYAAFSNWTLSSNRAMAARAQLLAGSMNPESVLQVVGMADRAPIDTKNATAGVNRRIELLVLTRAQATNVAAMFGVPGPSTQALTDEVDTTVPAGPAGQAGPLQRLREQLLPSKGEPLFRPLKRRTPPAEAPAATPAETPAGAPAGAAAPAQ